MFYCLTVLLLCYAFGATHSVLTSLPEQPFQNPKTIITLDLSSYDKQNKATHVFVNKIQLSENPTANINVVNAPSGGNFFVIQVHSLKATLQLSDQNGDDVVTGRDTGLVEVNLQEGVTYQYLLSCVGNFSGDVNVLMAVVVYENQDPVPGGCNLTFKPELSAYQNVTYTDSMVKVDTQSPSFYNSPCGDSTGTLEMYHLYMREHTFDENEYFESITKMLTVDGIIDNAKLVRLPSGVAAGRRLYSAYIGTGSVYAALATSLDGRQSAYIPAISYACDTDNWDDSCVSLGSAIWKVLIALLLFVGLFSLFVGHIGFRVQTFFTGFIFGLFFGYVISGRINNLSGGANATIAITFGMVTGAIWSTCWSCCGLPFISVLLATSTVGYAICCIIFYTIANDTEVFQGDLNYWAMFICVIVLFFMLTSLTKILHIFACCFIGASIVTIAINFYAGGNLDYIFVNNIRRITVDDFNKATIHPVFQYTDVLLSVWFLILFGIGLVCQTKANRDREAFPNPSHNTYCCNQTNINGRTLKFFNAGTDERTPFLRAT